MHEDISELADSLLVHHSTQRLADLVGGLELAPNIAGSGFGHLGGVSELHTVLSETRNSKKEKTKPLEWLFPSETQPTPAGITEHITHVRVRAFNIVTGLRKPCGSVRGEISPSTLK